MILAPAQRSACIPRLEPIPFDSESVHSVDDLICLVTSKAEGTVRFGEHVAIGWTVNMISLAPIVVKWCGHVPELLFDPERVVAEVTFNGALFEQDRSDLCTVIRKAEHARKSSFRRCSTCGELTPPEHRVEGHCHACFEQTGGAF